MHYQQNQMLEYKILDVLDKRFLWLPELMIFFESNSLLEEVLSKYNKMDKKDILKLYSDNDTQKQVSQLLQELDSLQPQIEQYRSGINILEKKQRPLNSLEINIAHACNLRCKYCLAGDGSHGKDQFMANEDAERAIDFLIMNSGDSKKLYIAIIGGEPLMNLPVFIHVLEYATTQAEKFKKSVEFTTTVNGTLLTPEVLEQLDKYNVRIMLSLDSHLEKVNDRLRLMANGRGSFSMIQENGWDTLLSNQNHRAIRMTITPYNLNFFETVKVFYEAGFYHVHVEEVVSDMLEFKFTEGDLDLLRAEYEKVAKYLVKKIVDGENISFHPLLSNMSEIHQRQPKVNHCGAMKFSLGVSANLGIYPCDTMMWDDYKIGNMFEGVNVQEILEKVANSRDKYCSSCWARYICGSGCLLKHIKAYENKLDCELELFKYKLQLYVYSEIIEKRPKFFERFSKDGVM
ncbi:MAG: radical SAM protein [Halanaerobiales bacterium]|nr:radical SAM protein [Halanaerobiales bacterium]